jgi:signal transduction histidine kinase
MREHTLFPVQQLRFVTFSFTMTKRALYQLASRLPRGRLRTMCRWLHLPVFWRTDPLNRERLGLRLRSKIFLGSALTILILAGVSTLSLGAVGRLVSANREISTHAIPALSLTASNREAIPRLRGLEVRAIVLRDPRYATAWAKLAAEVAEDFERLATYALSEAEGLRLREASGAFEDYRRIVTEEHAALRRGDRAHALHLTDTTARARGEQVAESLGTLMAATRARILAAQAEAASLEARTWSAVPIALGVAVGLALLGTAIIARRITRSLDQLSSATMKVAANKFHEPLAIEGRDEIAALARSFNSMASQLRQIEEEKQEFFASLSHELRSPLTSIRGAIDLLHRATADPLTQRQVRLTEVIGQSSDRLLRLVNQILEVSRFRAGLVELDRGPLDLAVLVDRVVEELHPQAEQADVDLQCERYGFDFAYVGDAERLYQLVLNLGTNAIRFTPRGGRVVVRVIDAGAEFELHVEDTGIGIPANALSTIFEPYRQAHQHQGGSGLGLALVQAVSNAHGGRVTAESREGKGSRFTVLLPRPQR